MKIANQSLQVGLGLLLLLFPVGAVLASCLGYAFVITSIPVYGFLMAVCSLMILVLEFLLQDAKWAAYLLPISVLTSFMCIFRCREPFVIGCTLVATGCLVVLTLRYKKHVLLSLSATLILLLFPLCGLFSLPDGLSANTVVQTIPSPDGSYYAKIIDSDQGAMGGNTFVDVYSEAEINVLLFRLEKKPQRVYTGYWGEYKNLCVTWKDNGCLVINSVLYQID